MGAAICGEADGGGRVLLCDLDGTLIDPFVGLAASYRAAADAVAYGTLSDSAIRELIGPPIQDVFENRWGLVGADHLRAIEAFRVYYRATGILEYEVYPGVDELLAQAAVAVPVGVATSKPQEFVEVIVGREGWSERLSVVCGARLDGVGRRKAEVIASALSRCGREASGCVMLGDRAEDMIGACETGAVGLGALWGYGSEGELRDAGAIELLATVRDAIETVNRRTWVRRS